VNQVPHLVSLIHVFEAPVSHRMYHRNLVLLLALS
jgi:hypothetical protein